MNRQFASAEFGHWTGIRTLACDLDRWGWHCVPLRSSLDLLPGDLLLLRKADSGEADVTHIALALSPQEICHSSKGANGVITQTMEQIRLQYQLYLSKEELDASITPQILERPSRPRVAEAPSQQVILPFNDALFSWYHGDLAVSLADRDPAEAERMQLNEQHWPQHRCLVCD